MERAQRTIGQLAREAGVHVETVRYYERRRLMKQPKRSTGWRLYGEDALRTLQFVKRTQELGFSLTDIEELLSLRSSTSVRTCNRVRAKAEAKLADVEAKLRDLTAIRGTLEELVRACPNDGPPGACPILDSIARCNGGCGGG